MNLPPVFTNATTSASEPGLTPASHIVFTATANDPEHQPLIYSLSDPAGSNDAQYFSIDTTGATPGAIRFLNTPDADAPFNPGETPNTYNLIVNVSDGVNRVSENVTITVTGNIAAATFADPNPAPVSVPENTNTTTAVFQTFTNPGLGTITYSLKNDPAFPDDALFTIDTSGQLFFIAPPNYENPAHGPSYTVDIVAHDSGGLADGNQVVTVNVFNVNEAPVFNNAAIAANHILFQANQAAASLVFDGSATDPDAATPTSGTSPPNPSSWSTLTYSFASSSSTDAQWFNLDPTNGHLTFKASPDFNLPKDLNGDNVYDVTIRATDGGGLLVDLPVHVEVTLQPGIETKSDDDKDTQYPGGGETKWDDDKTAQGPDDDKTAQGPDDDKTAKGPDDDKTAQGPDNDKTAKGPDHDKTAEGPGGGETKSEGVFASTDKNGPEGTTAQSAPGNQAHIEHPQSELANLVAIHADAAQAEVHTGIMSLHHTHATDFLLV